MASDIAGGAAGGNGAEKRKVAAAEISYDPTMKGMQLGKVKNIPDRLEIDRSASCLIVYDERLDRPYRDLLIRLHALLHRSFRADRMKSRDEAETPELRYLRVWKASVACHERGARAPIIHSSFRASAPGRKGVLRDAAIQGGLALKYLIRDHEAKKIASRKA